jgi:hypothetical protein
MRIIISIVVSLAIASGMYIMFLKSAASGSSGGSPKVVISTTTVQMQLVNIAEAEKMYFVQNSSFGSLDELAASNTFKLKFPDPDDYEYSVDATASGFKATARHAFAKGAKADNYPVISIDQNMQVERSDQSSPAQPPSGKQTPAGSGQPE